MIYLAIKLINMLALALVGHEHQWTKEERSLYERFMRLALSGDND